MHKRNALEGVDMSYHPTPINRLGTAEECGDLIAFLLSDESTFISGATYSVDGGWHVNELAYTCGISMNRHLMNSPAAEAAPT